ncbi:MAG TPA: PD-(D/E)XK nuclease family protein, partial [Anaeromyxobacter sp.]
MKVLVLDGPASLADAVASLPAAGPLPARTVLVPSERHAHALRRALARSGRSAALAGTRFVGSLTAAIEVLRTAGVPFSTGEDALRPARLLALFREDLRLEHFDLPLLRATRGWEDAFAAAIGDLEAAGLSPADLPGEAAHARDLAALWARAGAEAGASFTDARAMLEAAALLSREGAWAFDGPTLAIASGHEPAAQARFLAAIPGVVLGLRVARPAGARLLQRIERLYGPEARKAVERGRGPVALRPGATERDLLATYLFADAKALADPGRPRSKGPDGSVDLDEHAGVEAELEAAAAWVSRQVLEARRPLEEIAILVPSLDPLAQLAADRLERLPFEGGPLPVYVAGGLPAVATAAGARVLAVLRA